MNNGFEKQPGIKETFSNGKMGSNKLSCEEFHLEHITSINQVISFADHLVKNLGVNFHPDNDFDEYINLETKEPSFTDEEVAIGNMLMNECCEVCEKDGVNVYELMEKSFY